MRRFIISTDTTCDLPQSYCKDNLIDIHSLFYRFGEKEIYGDDNILTEAEFYSRMRNGEMPTTMANNPEDSRKIFESRVREGYDIIHIAFSSALSSACQNTKIAANAVMEAYPECCITVIDSLSASMGEGLLVYKAVQYMNNGHSYQETVSYIEDTRLSISHQFTVDDLFHLHRGGRVSKATAVIGTIINIKPLLHVDDEGRLISIGKVRGRKKSLISLVDKMEATMGDKDNSTIMISHGDCLDDALFVKELVLKRCDKVHNVLINYVCPTIGAHSGPGTVALFFEADTR